MSWDQADFSFDHGQPPTPSRTPTSPSFHDLFQTPRLDSTFLDAKSSWNGNDASSHFADILRTPRARLFSTSSANSPAVHAKQLPSERQGTSSALVSNAEKLLSTPSLQALQTDQTPRFGQTPLFGNKSPHPSSTANDAPLDATASFNSASSIQTPPPTSTSAARRKGQQSEGGNHKPLKSAAERRMSVPIAPKPTVSSTPTSHNENADPNSSALFSPSVFGYDFSSPATAPSYPPAKLLWGNDEPAGNNLDFLNQTPGLFGTPRQSQDPFGFNEQPALPAARSNVEQSNVRFAVPADEDDSFASTSFASRANQMQTSQAFGAAVNPSLLFSSPSKLPGPSERLSSANRVLSEESLQPYAYQMQEARRERAGHSISKIQKRRKPSMDSPAVQAALQNLRDDSVQRPGFRRSMTDPALPTLHRNTPSSASASSHRRSSPIKRQRDPNRRAKRTSLALTIDENGRASTQTRVIEDTDESDAQDAMEVDRHSDDSSSSSSDGEFVDFTSAPKTAMPRLGRFSTSASHSKKSSHASLHSSSASYHEDPKLPEPRDRRSFGANKLSLQPLKEASFGSENERYHGDTAKESDAEEHNAQAELRKLAQQRHQSGRGGVSFAEMHEAALANLSPTTVTDPDLATPTSGKSGEVGIRCVCNVAVDEGQMIQCESCRNWLHVPCTGLESQRLPTIYLCLFCTGSTPVARGGRIRDPAKRHSGSGRTVLGGSSPLAHKTGRYHR